VRLLAQGFLGLLGGVIEFTALGAALIWLDIGLLLKDASVSLVGKPSMIRLGQSPIIIG